MNITGIEVIKRNPGVATGVVAGEKLELTYGDTLRVNVSFDYRGLAGSVTLYGAIGQVLWPTGRFDPILKNEVSIDLPESLTDFTPCERSVDIPITSDISPKTGYGLRVKFPDYLEVGQPQVDGVIDIVGIPPTYELLEETIYPYAYVYDGPYDGGTFTFKSDPFTPADWIAGKFAQVCEAEVEKAGGRVLETRVYVDRSPLLWTNWRVEIVGISPEVTAGTAISFVVPLWVAILLVILGLIALIVVGTWAWKEIAGTFEHKPISPEIKATWSTETLISTIGDFEAKLIEEEKIPGPLTPVEELEEMSDEGLRTYCDELAEFIVPPPVPIPPWAVLAVLGVLGIGGVAAAYAMSKPKEAA